MPRSILGRYEILGELGSGGMGVVLCTRDPELDREIAIKGLHAVARDPERVERFRREARGIGGVGGDSSRECSPQLCIRYQGKDYRAYRSA